MLRQEAMEYQEYLQEQRRLEKEREAEIDKYYMETNEAVSPYMSFIWPIVTHV